MRPEQWIQLSWHTLSSWVTHLPPFNGYFLQDDEYLKKKNESSSDFSSLPSIQIWIWQTALRCARMGDWHLKNLQKVYDRIMSTWSRTSKIYSQNLWGIHKDTETDWEQREVLPSISIATKCLLVYFSNHELLIVIYATFSCSLLLRTPFEMMPCLFVCLSKVERERQQTQHLRISTARATGNPWLTERKAVSWRQYHWFPCFW